MVSVKREVALPRDWWAMGLEGTRGLWELFDRPPAHGCAPLLHL